MAIPSLSLRKDKNANVTYGLDFPPPSGSCFSFTLVAGVEQTLVIPSNVNRILFEYAVGTNNYATISDNPVTLPAAGVNAYNAELNPILRDAIAGETLRVICDTASNVVVRFYKVPHGER